jgi:hypothetical protein
LNFKDELLEEAAARSVKNFSGGCSTQVKCNTISYSPEKGWLFYINKYGFVN